MKNFIVFLVLLFITAACSETTVKTSDAYEVVELPDNSIVYLNKNSSISFDEKFENRHITLQGEAFFDVEEGDSPFIVHTENGDINVVGTEFHVKSIGKELKVQVKKGLVELKIDEKIEQLKHGQQVVFNRTNKEFKRLKADLEFDVWISDMEKEYKKLNKVFKRRIKSIKKENKSVKKDLKKVSKDIKKAFN